MQCVVCGTDRWPRIFNRLQTDFVRCATCGLIRMEFLPSQEEIQQHYSRKAICGNYELLQRYDLEYEIVYRQFLNLILRYSGDPRGLQLFDIGCFTGRFLDKAQEAGFITYGVEYQTEAARIANERHDGRVYCGSIENYSPLPDPQFAIVTAFGVIEHVTAPDMMVKLAAGQLKQGGLFVIQTPNTASFPASILGKYWPPYTPVEHIHYFSSQNIKILLGRYGFSVIRTINHWKKLPVGYVYNQFQNFGPEFRQIFSKIMPFLPHSVLDWKLPFYVGEMIVIAQKT